ncbi:MAG: hypothetical protein KDC48_10680 [Planctomycetes bacterium]|nr:hypothetical protein [Planctomycetota bacterium]
MPLPLVVLLLLLAATGGGVAANLFVQGHAAPAGPASDGQGAAERATHDLVQRIAALEQQLAAPVAERADGDAIVQRTPADPDLRPRVEQLERRVDALAQAASAAQGTARPEPVDRAAELAARALTEQQRRTTHQTTILDPAATDEARIGAWRELRGLPDSYDDGVVAVMTQLGLSSADEKTRADVWRQAHGRSTHPALGVAMVQALQSDAAASAREEAAETLEYYLDAPGVRQALEIAAQGDADEKVRRQASRTLNAKKR